MVQRSIPWFKGLYRVSSRFKARLEMKLKEAEVTAVLDVIW